MNDRWERIVQFHSAYRNAKERDVQSLWEGIFSELLGYSKLSGEIETQRSIQIGSTERVITDLIIKSEGCDCYVVEIKQHNMRKTEKMERQLFSYLKQLRLDLGILICDKMYIFNYDYTKADTEQSYMCIDFTKNSDIGSRIVDLLDCKKFDKLTIFEAVQSQNTEYKDFRAMKSQLQDTGFILELIKNHFTPLFGDSVCSKVLSEIEISVKNRSEIDNSSSQSNFLWVQEVEQPRVSRGSNEQIVMGIFWDLQQKKLLDDNLVQQFQSLQFGKSMFKLRGNKYPILVLADEFSNR